MQHTPIHDDNSQRKLLTPEELRKRWSVSGMFLHRARAAGKLPYLKLGKHVRYRLEDVEKFEKDASSK